MLDSCDGLLRLITVFVLMAFPSSYDCAASSVCAARPSGRNESCLNSCRGGSKDTVRAGGIHGPPGTGAGSGAAGGTGGAVPRGRRRPLGRPPGPHPPPHPLTPQRPVGRILAEGPRTSPPPAHLRTAFAGSVSGPPPFPSRVQTAVVGAKAGPRRGGREPCCIVPDWRPLYPPTLCTGWRSPQPKRRIFTP